MKRENYLHISGWMYEFDLTRIEREIFALIYGFSQSGQGEFVGSLTYISEMVGVHRSSVSRGINTLIKKNLVVKTVYGKKNSNGYSVNLDEIDRRLNGIENDTENDENETSRKMRLVAKCDQSQNETSCIMRPVTSRKMRLNNNINNIYINSLAEDELNAFIKKWNEDGNLEVVHFIPERKEALISLKEKYGLPKLYNALDKIRASDFLRGRSSSFIINFDWFVKEENFVKVLEGNYDHNAPDKPKPKKLNKQDFENKSVTYSDMDDFEKSILSN